MIETWKLTVIQYCCIIYRLHSNSIIVFPVSFSIRKIVLMQDLTGSGSLTAFIVLPFASPLTREDSSVFLCLSWPWYFWRIKVSYFAEFPQLGFVWYFFITRWAGIVQKLHVLGASCRRPLVSIFCSIFCTNVGDVTLDHVFKLVSTRSPP